MLIKAALAVQLQCVERWLQRCAGSVSVLRWTSWQAMETKLFIIELPRFLVPTYECSLLQFLDWPDDQYCYTSTNQAVWTFTKSPGKTLHHLFLRWFSASQPSPQRCQNWRLHRRTRQENWGLWWLLYVYNVGVGTLTQRLLWRCKCFWWWWPHGFRGRVFLSSQWDLSSWQFKIFSYFTRWQGLSQSDAYSFYYTGNDLEWSQTVYSLATKTGQKSETQGKAEGQQKEVISRTRRTRSISWFLIFSSILNVEATISMSADFYQQKMAQLRGDFTV